jgi:hypothetical protein
MHFARCNADLLIRIQCKKVTLLRWTPTVLERIGLFFKLQRGDVRDTITVVLPAVDVSILTAAQIKPTIPACWSGRPLAVKLLELKAILQEITRFYKTGSNLKAMFPRLVYLTNGLYRCRSVQLAVYFVFCIMACNRTRSETCESNGKKNVTRESSSTEHKVTLNPAAQLQREMRVLRFPSGVIEDSDYVGYNVVSLGKWFATFRRNVSPSAVQGPWNDWLEVGV